MELSKLPFTLKPQNTVSDLSIAPYFPFARVIPVDQALTELATHMEAVITLAPVEGAQPFCSVCGENGGRLHMYGTRRVRDLNLAHARVELVVPNRKLRCATCRTIRTEGHSFLEVPRRFRCRAADPVSAGVSPRSVAPARCPVEAKWRVCRGGGMWQGAIRGF
jgi:hypothetical protein